MALYLRIISILVALVNFGLCLHHSKTPASFIRVTEGALTPKIIGTDSFEVQWNPEVYDGNGNDEFTIKVDVIYKTFPFSCEIQQKCTTTSTCIFTSTRNPTSAVDTCTSLNARLDPCNEVTVTVSRGNTNTSITFDLAPHINTEDIVPTLSLKDHEVSIAWISTDSTPETDCSTHASIEFNVEDASYNYYTDFTLGDLNTFNETLPDSCHYGPLSGKIVYYTSSDLARTDRIFEAKETPILRGGAGGVTRVSTSTDSCSIQANWEVNCTASSYSITYAPGGTDPISVNDTAYVIKDLDDTSYTVSIQAYWEDGEIMGDKIDSISTVVPSVAPVAPNVKKPQGDDVKPTALTLSWDQPEPESCTGNITQYNIFYQGADDTDNKTDTAEGTASSMELTGLIPCTEYKIFVAANWIGESEESGTTEVRTGSLVPGKSTGLSNPSKTSSTLDVNWSSPLDSSNPCPITSYTVQWVSSSGGDQKEGTVTEPPYTITGLIACTDYDIKVIAYTDKGAGDSSETLTSTTDTAVPGYSTDVRKTDDEPDSMRVEWKAPSDNPCEITKYTVQWANKSADTTEPFYTIPDLTPCKYYVITVIAYTDKGAGEPTASVSLRTGTAVPVKSTGLSNPSKTSTTLEVNWSSPLDSSNPCPITSYTVQWVSSSDGDQKEGTATEPPYTITGLIACTDYDIRVIAYTEKGPGDPSETLTSTTDTAVPGKSTGLKKNGDSPYSMDVVWTRPSDNPCEITNYIVQWADDKSSDTTEPFYTIPDLTPCTNYSITVIAYTDKGAGEPTEPVTLKTGTAVPGKSTGLSNPSKTSSTLDVNWSPPLDSSNPCPTTSYTVQWVNSSGGDQKEGTITNPPYTITGLIACTDYDIKVIAYTEKGPGDPSETVTFTTDIDFPGISNSIARESFTPYSLRVTWSPPPTSPPDGNPCPITNYIVQWSNSSDEADVETEIVTEPHLNITDLEACTDYYITVTVYTEKGAGESSDIKKMPTGVEAPPVAEDKIIITSTSQDAQVTWEIPETLCNLTFDLTHSGTTLWTNNQVTDPGYSQTIVYPKHDATLFNLLPYANYTVCVAIENHNYGKTSCKAFITKEAVPSAPRNVSIDGDSVTDVSLTLTWELPVAENGILLNYVVSWCLEQESWTNQTVDANITSHQIEDLQEGYYIFIVKAVNSVGSSPQSESIELNMNGSSSLSGGTIAGIVIGILLVALAIPAFIFRDRIMKKIKQGSSSSKGSGYELKGIAILKSDFRRQVTNIKSDGAKAAYEKLINESPHKDTFAATKPFNKNKNRYDNIYPFNETRVKLQLLRSGPKGSDYINANHVTFPEMSTLQFIATQGPLDNTICDFWRMVWEQNVYDVVMLCNLVEEGESKCANYWSDKGKNSVEFGDFIISCQAEEDDKRNQTITRYIDLVKNGQRRIVKQHHYVAWPDNGVPDSEDDMLKFLASIKGKLITNGKHIVVHGSAGVGRTGTLIGLWALTNILEENKSSKNIDVHMTALRMRECRQDMVQTKDQYLYLHKCLLKYMEDTGNSFPISNKDKKDPIYGNVNTGYQQ